MQPVNIIQIKENKFLQADFLKRTIKYQTQTIQIKKNSKKKIQAALIKLDGSKKKKIALLEKSNFNGEKKKKKNYL